MKLGLTYEQVLDLPYALLLNLVAIEQYKDGAELMETKPSEDDFDTLMGFK